METKTKIGLILGVLLMIGSVSAALLTHYGTVTGTADVRQAVVLEGDNCIDNICTYEMSDSPTATAGNSYRDGLFVVKNRAEVPATIELGTRCQNTIGFDDGTPINMSIDWSTIGNNKCDGIVTSYFGVLELSSKDSNWQPTDDMNATLYYSLTANEFGYDLTASGLTATTDYSLIYYADKPDRFVAWGGNNPGALITTATSDCNGDLATIGSNDISMNLPHPNDANVDEYNYCLSKVEGGTGDMYEHCYGAKLWLIPSADYNENTQKITGQWDRTKNLYETDLIAYTKGTDNKIVLPANGGGFSFEIWNSFAINTAPDIYTIETNVNPV